MKIRRKFAFVATPTYPILLVPCQMARQDVWTRRGEHREVLSAPVCLQGADTIGRVSWSEPASFWLLFLSCLKKE